MSNISWWWQGAWPFVTCELAVDQCGKGRLFFLYFNGFYIDGNGKIYEINSNGDIWGVQQEHLEGVYPELMLPGVGPAVRGITAGIGLQKLGFKNGCSLAISLCAGQVGLVNGVPKAVYKPTSSYINVRKSVDETRLGNFIENSLQRSSTNR